MDVAQRDGLYHLCFKIIVRDFKGQTSAPSLGTWDVLCSSYDDLASQMWEKVAGYIRNHVGFGDDGRSPHWSEEQPTAADLDHFVVVHDESAKRSYPPSRYRNSDVLNHVCGKTLTLYVHRYSLSVTSAAMFKLVSNALLQRERDRAGAASIALVDARKESLRRLHPEYFAYDTNWLQWAAWIEAQPQQVREERAAEAPPPHLSHLFRMVPIDSGAVLHNMQTSMRVTRCVSERFKRKLEDILDTAKTVTAGFKTVTAGVNLLMTQLESLHEAAADTEEMIAAMEAASRPGESDFGRRIAAEITNEVDVDHDNDMENMDEA
ncbi:Uncharacterized protein PBTT_06925 [Plasmodiophora brassicae]